MEKKKRVENMVFEEGNIPEDKRIAKLFSGKSLGRHMRRREIGK